MIKRIVVIVLSFLLLALCFGGLLYLGQSSNKGVQQDKGIVVKFYSDDGTLLSREKYKKGETVVFPEYSAPDGYYFEGWKIDGEGEIITSCEVQSSLTFVPFLSEIFSFDGSQNFEFYSDNGVNDYSSVSFDYKIISGDYFAVSLFGDRWHNDTYEYVVFGVQGFIGNSESVQVRVISDDWLHVELPYYVYESACLSRYDHHDDYGSFEIFHVCMIASGYACRTYSGDVAEVLLKNITFNE